jgi:hypothetical protein
LQWQLMRWQNLIAVAVNALVPGIERNSQMDACRVESPNERPTAHC